MTGRPLDFTKTITTRDGREVEILDTELDGWLPILGIVERADGLRYAQRWAEDGKSYDDSNDDLIEVPDAEEIGGQPNWEAAGYHMSSSPDRISLRDFYIAHCLNALIAKAPLIDTDNGDAAWLVERQRRTLVEGAIKYADLTLARR